MSCNFNSQDPDDAQVYSLRHDGWDMRLSPNFKLGEFSCNDGTDKVIVHPALVALLERIRQEIGDEAIMINSGYRTTTYNRRIGGAKRSKHLLGCAADIRTAAASPAEVANIAEDLGAGGIGRYKTFCHVDVIGRNRRW